MACRPKPRAVARCRRRAKDRRATLAEWRWVFSFRLPTSIDCIASPAPISAKQAVDQLQGPDLVAEGRRAVLTRALIEAAVRTAAAPAAIEWRRRLAELEEYQALIVARLRGDQELFKIADVDAPRLTRGDGTDETSHDRDAPDRSSSPDDDR